MKLQNSAVLLPSGLVVTCAVAQNDILTPRLTAELTSQCGTGAPNYESCSSALTLARSYVIQIENDVKVPQTHFYSHHFMVHLIRSPSTEKP